MNNLHRGSSYLIVLDIRKFENLMLLCKVTHSRPIIENKIPLEQPGVKCLAQGHSGDE